LLLFPNRIAADALNRPQTALPSALVAEYLQRCRSDLAQLKQVLPTGEYETARRLGHQMKGTGKPYGFPELTQIGRAIEWAASKHAAAELSSRIQRLEICLNGIELASERED
jgi:HPt (histidine-containing phosphotransfer) domain-containing protein